MNDLATLIRLARWRLDEKRRALAELQVLEERLRREAERLDEEIRQEQEVARGSVEAAHGYDRYAAAAIARGKKLRASIGEVERQLAAATDEMAEAFQELKRYELAQEERMRRDRLRTRRREAAVLDEIAATGFLRRPRDS